MFIFCYVLFCNVYIINSYIISIEYIYFVKLIKYHSIISKSGMNNHTILFKNWLNSKRQTFTIINVIRYNGGKCGFERLLYL